MSEQAAESPEDDVLARALAESAALAKEERSRRDAFSPIGDSSTDCTSDVVLARMLQQQFDQEYQASTINQSPKARPVTIVYSDDDDEEEQLECPDEQRDYIRQVERAITVGGRGYATVNGQLITKHDPELCGHKNTQKITDNMPLSFPCGAAHTSNQPISNRIYNQLRKSAYKDQKRKQRHKEEKERSTAEKAVDENTRILLQKLINVGLVDSYGGIIAAGKEAIVIHATGGIETELDERLGRSLNTISEIPGEMAVKVFKTTLNEFRQRDKYIKDDYRFRDRFRKMNPRKMIRMWCEKELFNLKLLLKAGIAAPEPVCIKKHVLLMRFIGDQGIPAPRLSKCDVPKEKTRVAIMEQIFEAMEKMFQLANIVHGDFSEFNLLYHQRRVWVIDVSQAVTRDHPFSLDFLMRDCRSIHRFLDKTWQLPDVPQPEAIFNRVTKFDFGHELADDAETETVLDLIKFKDELEAAKMELQRRNNLKRGQFSEMLGDHDNFNDDGNQDEYDQDEYIEFLNHLSDVNAKTTHLPSGSSSDDESVDEEEEGDDDPEKEAEKRLGLN